MIAPGQKMPSLKIKRATAEGPKDVDPAELCAGKRAVIFSLPGAFTPTCSNVHLPSYVLQGSALHAKGVDLIACLSVNDAWVMQAWGQSQGVGPELVMLADGGAALTRALGLEFEIPALGVRAQRAVMVFEDGVLKSIDVEQGGKYEVSSAEACLRRLS